MKKFAVLLASLLAFNVFATEIVWTDPVDIVGYSVTEQGEPHVEIFYTGTVFMCSESDKLGKVTYTNSSNSAEIQKAMIMDVISTKSRGGKMSFATTDLSVCNANVGLRIFGIRTVAQSGE